VKVVLTHLLLSTSPAAETVTTLFWRCVVQWLLRPVHSKWTEARWLAHLDSPAAFAAEYMQYEVQADGTVVVGSRYVAGLRGLNWRGGGGITVTCVAIIGVDGTL
jgi:hypothetical protein